MNTEIKIRVKGNPEEILDCAYASLLSLDSTKRKVYSDVMINQIDKNLMFASAVIKHKISVHSFELACLLYVTKIDENICELTFTNDSIETCNYGGEGYNIIFMSKLLQVFSGNYGNR